MKYQCEKCSKEFQSYPSSNRKYCSRKCFERRRKSTICKGCGIEFYIPGEPNMKYHNQECYFKNGLQGTFQIGHEHNKGKTHPQYVKDKISKSHRLIRAKWVKDWMQGPMFNVEGCKKILEYGEKHGYEFQTAINGGEYFIEKLGYWVDGYDIEKNVVIEYYEKYHTTPKHENRDKKREKKIIETLKCKFIIIYYDNKIKIWE